MRKPLFVSCLLLFFVILATAKDNSQQILVWPPTGNPVVRITFGKFKELGTIGNLHTYLIDTMAENLWTKKLSYASFSLYLFDKNKARIGEGTITLSNVPVGQIVKFQTTVSASGSPASLEITPTSLPPELGPAAPPRTISITVNSVPQGALFKLDGKEIGATPKVVQASVGQHQLEFAKEGFNTGHFPLEITTSDSSGGSVSYELGASAHDSLEMRDGSVLVGDLQAITATELLFELGEHCSTSIGIRLKESCWCKEIR
jgi:PEGA domain